MSSCKTLFFSSFNFKCTVHSLSPPPPTLLSLSFSSLLRHHTATSRCYTSAQTAAAVAAVSSIEEPRSVQQLLTSTEGVSALMKMDRKPLLHEPTPRWFPYIDRFRSGDDCVLNSSEVIEAVAPCISDTRKIRFENAVRNRSYSVCLVVEGLRDFGNVSAAFRSADALGVQSVHVVSSDANKRC